MHATSTTPKINVSLEILNLLVDRAVEYLKEYYDRADSETYFFIAALNKQGKFIQQAFKVRELYENDARVREFVEKNIHNNLYYSINTFRTAKRIAREVANILALAFDFDLHRPISEPELEKILNVLRDFEQQGEVRLTIVKSGGGVQALILPDRSMSLADFIIDETGDDEFRAADMNFKKLMNALASILEEELRGRELSDVEVDRAVFDFARVMRLPYTFNMKYDEPAEVELLKFEMVDRDELVKSIRSVIKVLREEEKEETALLELDDDKIQQIAIALHEQLGNFYTRGRRHFIALSLAGYMRKYTNLDEQSAKRIIQMLAQLLMDDEIKDRVRAVEDTYKKKVEDVSAFSILLNVMNEEELEKFKNTLKTVFEKFAVAKFDTFVYSLVERTINTKKFVTMSNDGIKLVIVRYDEDKKYPARDTLIAYAYIKINKIIRLHKNNAVATLYSVTITDTVSKQKIELRDKTVEEIARAIRDLGLAVVSQEKLSNYIAAILKRLEVVKRISIEDIYAEFDVNYDAESGQYKITDPSKLKRVIDAGADINRIDMYKVYRILNNIAQREKLFILLASAVASAFTKTDSLLRTIIILEGERGTGKTTLARFFTTTAFLNNEGSNDTLLSEFRTIELLTQSYTPVLVDDAEMTRIEVQKLLKSYVTGTYIVKRGRSNLKVEEYELKNSIIITSNNFYVNDDALKNRIIVLRADEKTFKTEEAAFETEDPSLAGWGYVLLKKVIDWLNERGLRFRDIVFEEYKEIELDDSRRARIYAQLFAALRILVEVVEDYELSEKLAKIYEKKNAIIKQLEMNQDTSEESILADTIVQIINNDDEVKKYAIFEFDKNNNTVTYITAAALKVIERKYGIKISLRRLADMLHTKVTTKVVGGRTTKVVKVTEHEPLMKYMS